MSSRFMKAGIATVLTAGALAVTATPAEAIPRGTHYWQSSKSGLSNVHAWGSFMPWSYEGQPTASVKFSIRDYARDGWKAAIDIAFYDRDYNRDTNDGGIYYKKSDGRGTTRARAIQSDFTYALEIRECKVKVSGNHVYKKKCGKWRRFYHGKYIN
ncbi:hypothetical protein GCM10027589_21340 [Actinocorallia lasiicapitis]